MRRDLEIIAALVNTGARVLDLGCGDGELLGYLAACKGVNGYGVEKGAAEISACLRAGVNVIEHDLDRGLERFPDNSFDMVVLSQTLQAVAEPSKLLDEMLRIGEQCVVTFPNFGHWRCRLQLATRGRMPVARHLPHQWYDTPNIHLCTFRDFEQLAMAKGLRILERFVVDDVAEPAERARKPGQGARKRPAECNGVPVGNGVLVGNGGFINRFPNLFGTTAFYRLARPRA